MKKITLLALCLILAMLFNFAACSNPNESTETTSVPKAEESTTVESESSTPTDATESTVPDTDTESVTDPGVVTVTDTNADTETETESNTDNQTDTGSETSSETDSESDSETDSETETDTDTDTDTDTQPNICEHSNVVANDNCEQICADCGEKVSDEPLHTPAEDFVASGNNDGTLVKKCTKCGTVVETTDCAHENTEVTYNTETYKKVTNCSDCGAKTEEDCPHENVTYSWVAGEAKENKTCTDCTFNEVVDARRVVIFNTCYNNGAIQSPVVDGTSTLTVDFGNKPTHIAQHGLVAGQWSYVSGGVKNYVFSVDGGNTWYMVHNTSSGKVATENHYNAVIGKIPSLAGDYQKNVITTVPGAVLMDTRTGNGYGLEVDQAKAVFYAIQAGKITDTNSSFTLMLGAVPTDNDTAVVTLAECINVVLSDAEKSTVNALIEETKCKHTNVTVNNKCEQICDDCGEKVSDELKHAEGSVSYDKDNYKMIVTCPTCGMSSTVDCPHKNITYSWVEGEAKENKTCADCTYNEIIDARFYVFFTSTYNSGSSNSAAVGGSTLQTVDYGNKPTHTANHGLVAGQWSYVSGGVKNYVFSVDGGNTWYAVHNVGASKVAGENYYNAVIGSIPSLAGDYHKNVITTVPGAVLMDTRTGNGYGLEVDQAQAFANAVLAGYITSADSTYTMMLGAVPRDNDTAVIPMVQINNIVLHSAEKTVVNDIVAKARCQHNDVIGNANCESICSFCGVKVSDEPFHTPANSFVPSETEEGVLVKKCTNCGTILERSNCSHENTKVTYNTETYKKVTTCTDCGNVTEEDCPHASNTYSWVEGEAKENKTCTDCTFNEVVDARRVVIFTTCYNNGAIQSPIVEGTSTLTVDFGNMPTHVAQHGLVAGQWSYVSGGVKNYVFSVDGGNTWYTVHNVSSGAVATENHYNAVIGKIPSLATEYEKNIITTVAGAVLFDTRTGNGYGLAVDQAHAVANAINAGYISGIDSSFTLMFGAVPRDNDTAVIPMVKCINVVLQASEKTAIDGLVCKHANATYSWVEGQAKEKISCTDCGREEVIDARFVMNVSSAYNNGASTQAAVEGKSLITVDYGNKPTHAAAHGLVSNGWSYVSGGVKEYVYSVDGGKTWYKVVNLSTKVASEAHYTAITKYYPEMANDTEHSVITGVAGAVMFDTRTGTGNGVEVNQAQAVANAVAAGDIASMTSSFTIILGAVPIENDTAIVPIAQFVNVKLP